MTLQDIIFSDGVIEQYEFHKGELQMTFRDYCKTRWQFSFRGDISVVENGSVGYSLSAKRLLTEGDRHVLEAIDDRNTVVLVVKYTECLIARL